MIITSQIFCPIYNHCAIHLSVNKTAAEVFNTGSRATNEPKVTSNWVVVASPNDPNNEEEYC